MSAEQHHGGDSHKESLFKRLRIKKFFKMGVVVALAGATVWTGVPEIAAAGILIFGASAVMLQKEAPKGGGGHH